MFLWNSLNSFLMFKALSDETGVNYFSWYACMLSCFSCVPMDCSPPGSSFMGFSRHEHWIGFPFPSPTHESEYMNRELPDVQASFMKGRGTRDQIANIRWIMEKAREFQKNIYFCFIDYAKAFDSVDHSKQWKILKEMGIPEHLTCLLRNLYAGQEATVRTGHGTIDWFQVGKGVRQGCLLSPCLFNFYAEYIMRNAGLEEAQAGIKILDCWEKYQ